MKYNVERIRRSITRTTLEPVAIFDAGWPNLRDAKRDCLNAALGEPGTEFMVREQMGPERDEEDALLYSARVEITDNTPGV